jgi:uncharacterized protein
MTDKSTRHLSLDALRGIAVMGILLMNITAFAMPEAGYMNPMAWGGDDPVNLAVWAVNFILIDGKMRALFSMLFGASMLLIIDRAEAADGDGIMVHLRRMGTLLLIGLFHHYFIWDGDILTLYAVIGAIVASLFYGRDRQDFRRWSIRLFGAAFLLWAVLSAGFVALDYAGHRPGASAEAVEAAKDLRVSFWEPNAVRDARELAEHRGSYVSLTRQRITEGAGGPISAALLFGFETAALMLLGMALFRTGAMTGEWDESRYRRAAIISYGIGLSGGAIIAALIWRSGFDALWCAIGSLTLDMPFQIFTMLGHASVAMILIKRHAGSALIARIAAAGRAAFSNYLGTSVVMTFVFYGYGLGWFGWVNRWQCMVIVLVAWVAMLAWSKPWLERFHYGPMEWLWRSMARLRVQPFVKA